MQNGYNTVILTLEVQLELFSTAVMYLSFLNFFYLTQHRRKYYYGSPFFCATQRAIYEITLCLQKMMIFSKNDELKK